MLKAKVFQIAAIHVPVKRAKTVDAGKVGQIAESILENGQTTPAQVRRMGFGPMGIGSSWWRVSTA